MLYELTEIMEFNSLRFSLFERCAKAVQLKRIRHGATRFLIRRARRTPQ